MLNQNPITYQKSEHRLPVAEISPATKKIISKLVENGFEAYLVGGAIRDLLLGLHPKDFDIATDATPEDIKHIFKGKCRIIGRRFRLAHVYMGNSIYEVATFRGSDPGDRVMKKGQIIRDNVFGTVDQDAIRRDFTCNALYFDLQEETILDFAAGVHDLKKGELKLIGNPNQRFIEDPVRMLRAVRFHAKLGLALSAELRQQIINNRLHLTNVPTARLFDETVKMFHCGNMEIAYKELMELRLFEILFPVAAKIIPQQQQWHNLLLEAFSNTDHRLQNGLSVTPVFLTACVLWLEFIPLYHEVLNSGKNSHDALHEATTQVMINQREFLMIPKAIQNGVRQMWMLQIRFKKMFGKGVYSTLHHPRFRAAYDFLLLRNTIDEKLDQQSDFWTSIQNMSPEGIKSLIFGKKNKRQKINQEL
ncbi:polynucleotide adenylyltransferase PcnB [Marinicella sp. S1101]|uniref:polynucleotide adenylyltransferase PcnB n=1 Tax=Marinicella marina TaxID=2996016 RepID=UPI0022608F32|nr:polynucleotide adenylyltransferase PcnB [Marinicella marina]MCX7554968.1 polynucleotide adenylyltransferase PcnB [Marinicella marina]MDJ1141578.1 polynucleotide adenylyltransferase PcnB [Marinicella marina]